MLDDPRFTLAQVADAAGCSLGTLRSWLQRKHFRLDMAFGDSPSEVAGKANLLSLRRALHIGAAVELIHNDVDPARAFKAARSFMDVFSPSFEIVETGGRVRDTSSGLFADGWTLLVAYPGVEAGAIMWVDDTQPMSRSPLANLFFPKTEGTRQVSGTFVWLNQVDRRVRTRLLNGDR